MRKKKRITQCNNKEKGTVVEKCHTAYLVGKVHELENQAQTTTLQLHGAAGCRPLD